MVRVKNGISRINCLNISKKLFVFFLLSTLIIAETNAQSINKRTVLDEVVYPSFGFSLGIFNPSDVNTYITNRMHNDGIVITSGASELFSFYSGHFNVVYKFFRWDFIGQFEYFWSPKVIMLDNGASLYYHLDCFSPGLMTNYNIKMNKKGRHFLFMGAGLTFSSLKFVDYTITSTPCRKYYANTLGLKFQAGFNFKFGTFNFKPNISYLSVRGVDDKKKYTRSVLELCFSGLQAGIDFSFHH
ncbi:MAG: hypothetical protein PHD97_02845 [Bacteroidales bacterium]|nr:hypothetical protein [Bacteroidales bacterium]